ncbi:hypothetical protein Tco_1564354 [Tanacetum coccineum]
MEKRVTLPVELDSQAILGYQDANFDFKDAVPCDHRKLQLNGNKRSVVITLTELDNLKGRQRSSRFKIKNLIFIVGDQVRVSDSGERGSGGVDETLEIVVMLVGEVKI